MDATGRRPRGAMDRPGRSGDNLEATLRDVSDRLPRGAYHARPVARVYIPKPDGRSGRSDSRPGERVQRATAEGLNAIDEGDYRFSYGFRPGRGPHDALDAVTVGIEKRKSTGCWMRTSVVP